MIVDLDIAIFHRNLTFKHLGVWNVADKDEYAVGREKVLLASLDIFRPDRFDFLRANYLVQNGVPDKFHFWVGEGAIL